MRLWHYKLIDVLPTKQLVSQFRECSAIDSMLKNNSLNNYIVNRVKEYSIEEFYYYCNLVIEEMNRRDFRMSPVILQKLNYDKNFKFEKDNLFKEWHNNRYLIQNLAYFQEKYDCKGITQEEYNKIYNKFKNQIDSMERLEV